MATLRQVIRKALQINFIDQCLCRKLSITGNSIEILGITYKLEFPKLDDTIGSMEFHGTYPVIENRTFGAGQFPIVYCYCFFESDNKKIILLLMLYNVHDKHAIKTRSERHSGRMNRERWLQQTPPWLAWYWEPDSRLSSAPNSVGILSAEAMTWGTLLWHCNAVQHYGGTPMTCINRLTSI